MKSQLLGDDVLAYVKIQFETVKRGLEAQPNDLDRLTCKLRNIESKLSKLAGAIEVVGVSETLANRLTRLEDERIETERENKIDTCACQVSGRSAASTAQTMARVGHQYRDPLLKFGSHTDGH